jgi:hypothetical protein
MRAAGKPGGETDRLAFDGEGLADVREEAGMGGAEPAVVIPGLVQAELAVDRETHFRSVIIFLAVIFPPADRAQLQNAGRIEGPVSTTGAAITNLDSAAHTGIDGKIGGRVYRDWSRTLVPGFVSGRRRSRRSVPEIR